MKESPVRESHASTDPERMTLLVVTEDPFFLDDVHQELTRLGAVVIGCMGPAQSPCELDEGGFCPLAERAAIVIVDSPSSGVFTGRDRSVPSGTYAARLAEAHPDRLILLSGAPLGRSGAIGDAVAVADRATAVSIAKYAQMARSEEALVSAGAEGGRGEG